MIDNSNPSTSFTRIAVCVREWVATRNAVSRIAQVTSGDWMGGHPGIQSCLNEADAELDAVLRCEARIRMDQAIETIEVAGNGILVILDDGQELSINATTGHINRC